MRDKFLKKKQSARPSDKKDEDSVLHKYLKELVLNESLSAASSYTVDLSYSRQLGDLAIRGFVDLSEKYSRIHDTNVAYNIRRQRNRSIAPSIDYSEEEHFSRLTSELLPRLKRQVVQIPLLPETSDSPTEAARKLKLLVKLQAELDTTIGHIRYAVNALRPTPLRRGENPPDDRHWMKLKRFRLSGLNPIFELDIMETCLNNLFCGTASTIRLRRLTNKPVLKYETNLKEGIVDLTLGKVDQMIRRLQGSELDLLQDDWAEQKDRLDSEIEKLYSLAYPTSHLQETNGRKKPPNPLVSHLGQIALPVVKLARTFINKISRRGINTKGCPLYTEMVSADLVTLSRLAEEVATWVGGITTCVRQAATYHMGHKAQKLKECLQTSLSLINEYILPLLPDTKDLPDQTLLKTWLATWSTHFDLAVKTLKMIDADR
ncbi:hypothetical protein MJO29_015328 [Puccinia striiformis f. sp. tritici]|nr:hypothetical protein MJO29_015328 [Puccinia striiformis f. sp. tritici]KAI9623395.1 hypothetical protein H4Q26_014563 [Puccinia striiformis f. sp. tritici PST-130]